MTLSRAGRRPRLLKELAMALGFEPIAGKRDCSTEDHRAQNQT